MITTSIEALFGKFLKAHNFSLVEQSGKPFERAVFESSSMRIEFVGDRGEIGVKIGAINHWNLAVAAGWLVAYLKGGVQYAPRSTLDLSQDISELHQNIADFYENCNLGQLTQLKTWEVTAWDKYLATAQEYKKPRVRPWWKFW